MSLSPICTAPEATSARPFLEPPAETSTLTSLFVDSNFSLAAFTSGCRALEPLARTVWRSPPAPPSCAAVAEADDAGCAGAGGGDLSHAAAPHAIARRGPNRR